MAKRKQTPDILAEGRETTSTQESQPPALVHTQVVTPTTPPLQKADDPVAAIFPQDQPRRSRSIRVKLTLPTVEGVMRAVRAYLTLELRALPDVMLVDEQADWELVIVGVPLPMRRDETGGIVVSVVVLHPQGQRKQAAYRGGSDFCGVWLRLCSPGQVRPVCQEIVARFNLKHLDAT